MRRLNQKNIQLDYAIRRGSFNVTVHFNLKKDGKHMKKKFQFLVDIYHRLKLIHLK